MTTMCRFSISGDQDNVHLPRGQVGGPPQPQHRAQLPPPIVRASHETVTKESQTRIFLNKNESVQEKTSVNKLSTQYNASHISSI